MKTIRKVLPVFVVTLAISLGHTRADDCQATIIAQPTNVVLLAPAPASFCVSATGDAPLFYQWFFKGARLGGATNRCFSIALASLPHLGPYTVVISNCAGAITSAPARLDLHGLAANYIPADPEAAELFRIDSNIDFEWSGRPFAGFPANNFSVTWRGEIEPLQSGPHSFYVSNLDDGARLWVNGVRLLDDWYPHSPFSWFTRSIELEAGQRYPIMVDYFERTAGASITLGWSGPSQSYQVIPAARLWVAPLGSNHPPNQPTIVYPANAEDSLPGLKLTAAIDFYSDFEGNGSYRFTEWEVWRLNPDERIWAHRGTNSLSLTQVELGAGRFENSQAGQTNLTPNTFYQLRVRHLDQQMAASPRAARNFNTFTTLPLVGIGTPWKYLDGGKSPGSGWTGTNYDDTAWASGFSMFGYRAAPTSTILDYGLQARDKPISYYFRTRFQLPNPESVEHLQYRMLLTGGAVIYLNGQEVLRQNMPGGEIVPGTRALATVPSGADARLSLYEGDASALTSNANVLAVEVHLSSPDLTRLRFHLQLTALTKTGEKLPVLVESTFRTDGEDWGVDRIGSTPLIPVFSSSNGNGDGFLSNYEAGDGTQRYWKAPKKFLGDRSACFGGFLEFDLKESVLSGEYHFDDVVLEGLAGRLVLKTPYNPDYSWTRYSVPLREDVGWRWNDSSGPAATRTELITVLAALTNLLIGSEYFSGPDTCSLDNARLVGTNTSNVQGPAIIAQPRDVSQRELTTVLFIVAATGSLPLTYQWFHNGEMLSVPSTNWLAISPLRSTHEGSYRVRISNAWGEVWSEEWDLAVTPDFLVLMEQPSSRTVEVGGSVTFRVEVESGSPLTYLWQRKLGSAQVNVGSAPVLTIPFVSTNHMGEYRVLVSNRAYAVTSEVALLTVVRDLIPPRLLSAILPFNTSNIVQFAVSEAMLTASARDTNQYRIVDHCSGLTFLPRSVFTSSALGQLLTPFALDRRRGYSLVVNGITDTSSNLIAAESRVAIAVATNVVLLRSSDPWWWNESDHDLGTEWRNRLDPSLFSGYGPGLLYHDPDPLSTCLGPPGTGIGLGPRTYYFWNTFVAYPLGLNGTLQLRLMADDGAVVYLNGTEVYRLNMPLGLITHATWADTTLSAPAQCFTVNLPVTNLLVGTNLIAVEVHQANAGSADALLGVELTQTMIDSSRPFICPPALSNDNLNLRISSLPGDLIQLEASTNLINWELLWRTNALGNSVTFEIRDPADFAQRYFRLRPGP